MVCTEAIATLTFVDSGVLIAAFRGQDEIARRAITVLNDANRRFASSRFIQLEVLPKPIYERRSREVAFYRDFFAGVLRWAEPLETLMSNAEQEAAANGLSGLDALHIAAAVLLGVDELITTEHAASPLFRPKHVLVTSLYGF